MKIIEYSVIKKIAVPFVVTLLFFMIFVMINAVPVLYFMKVFFIAEFTKSIRIILSIVGILLVLLFWRRHWDSGFSMFIGIIALIICAKWPSPSESLVVKTAKFTQFIYYQNELKKQAEKLQNNGVSPTLVTVCIDSFGSLAYGIAFDPTGEIMLPVKNRSRSWLLSAEQTELSIEGMEAKHIVGNYYSWLHP